MTLRSLTALVAASVLMLAAAIATLGGAAAPVATRVGGDLVPTLIGREGQVTELEVVEAADRITLRRAEDGAWVSADHGGYPVRQALVTATIGNLAALTAIEGRTARADRYHLIGVQPTDAEGSTAKRVVARDADGTVLADVLIGQERFAGWGVDEAVHVRATGQDQAWLAAGRIDLPFEPIDWLERRLMHVTAERLRQARISGPDRPDLVLTKATALDGNFSIQDLPEDRRVGEQFRVDNVARVLENLDLTDVRAQEGLDFTADGRAAHYDTFDGLSIFAELAVEDGAEPDDRGRTWVRFEAVASEDADADVMDEADRINAATAGWAYRLPNFKITRLTQGVDAITVAADGAEPVE